MRRSTVLSFNRIHGLDFFVKNRLFIFICVLFATGVAVGVFSRTGSQGIADFSEKLISDFIKARAGVSFFRAFISSVSSALLILIMAFVFGGSLLGFVLVPMLVLFCGFCYGIMSALVCSQFGIKGIAFIAVILIPSCLIFFVCFLFMSRFAVLFSWQIASLTLPKTQPVCLYASFKVYCARLAVSSVFCIVSALVDAMLSRALLRFFDFT